MKKEENKNPKGVFEKIPGSGVWWINYFDEAHKRHREKIGTKANAIHMYSHRKNAVWEGKKLPPSVRLGRDIRFSELCDDVLEYSKANKKSYADDCYRTAKLVAEFKDEVAEDITKQRFEKYLQARKFSLATQNRYVALLKLMYRKAEENGKITTNPARLLRIKKEDNGRVRFLRTDEEKALRAVIKRDYQGHMPELDIALNTGMRLSEQYGLEWDHVDFENGILSIVTSKTGKGRHIPLNDAALAALRELEKKRVGKYVFLRAPGHGAERGERVVSPREWFPDAVAKAALENFTFHTLRHSFASRLVMQGVDIRTVAELMGHKTIQMTMRYAHLSPEHKLDAVRRLAGFAPGRKKKDVVTSSHRTPEGGRKPRATKTATAAIMSPGGNVVDSVKSPVLRGL
jgi:integrase